MPDTEHLPRTAVLAQLIASKRDEIAALRKRYTELSHQLGTSTNSEALITQLGAVSTELASGGAALQTLIAAHDDATETERQAAAERHRADGLKRLQSFQQRCQARRARYDQLQAAADAFIAEVHSFRAEGRELASEGNSITMALKGDRYRDFTEYVQRAAGGTSRGMSQAIATVLRDVIDEFGSNELTDFFEVNRGMSVRVPFARAFELDAQHLKDQLR